MNGDRGEAGGFVLFLSNTLYFKGFSLKKFDRLVVEPKGFEPLTPTMPLCLELRYLPMNPHLVKKSGRLSGRFLKRNCQFCRWSGGGLAG